MSQGRLGVLEHHNNHCAIAEPVADIRDGKAGVQGKAKAVVRAHGGHHARRLCWIRERRRGPSGDRYHIGRS